MSSAGAEVGLGAIFVLFLQASFVLIHVGCVPTTNVNLVYLQHLVNNACTSIAFLLAGRSLATGQDWLGLVGAGGWLSWEPSDRVLESWGAAAYASCVIQLATAGRTHCLGNVLMCLLVCGFVHPVLMHQAWSPNGWMVSGPDAPFQDVAGGAVIHLFAGAFALGAMIVLGRRIIRVRSLDDGSMAINSQSTTVFGYFLLTICTVVFLSLPTYQNSYMSKNVIECIISLSVGIVTVACVSYIIHKKINYWLVIWILQGGLASLVTISSGVGSYHPLLVAVYALLGALAYTLASFLLRETSFEDYCNVVAVHLVPGALGSYLASLSSASRLDSLASQAASSASKLDSLSSKLASQAASSTSRLDSLSSKLASQAASSVSRLDSLSSKLASQAASSASRLDSLSSKLVSQAACSTFIFAVSLLLSLCLFSAFYYCRILRNYYEEEIHKSTVGLGLGCCPVFRSLDNSSADLIRPGFHTLQKLKSKSNERAAPKCDFISEPSDSKVTGSNLETYV